MYLRPFFPDDIPQLATILVTSFKNDELFDFLYPYKTNHPLSWWHWAAAGQWRMALQPGIYGFVCVSSGESTDGGPEGEIMGYSWWQHIPGKSSSGRDNTSHDPWMQNNRDLPTTVNRGLNWVRMKYEDWICQNPVIDKTAVKRFNKFVLKEDIWAPIMSVKHWHLRVLGVAVKYQRKGVGRKLVQWGLDRAKEETQERALIGEPPVPAVLISSVLGRNLYEAMGFRVVGHKVSAVDQIPEIGAWGGAMVWEPDRKVVDTKTDGSEVAARREEVKDPEPGQETRDGKTWDFERKAWSSVGGSCMVWDVEGYWTKPAPEGTRSQGKKVDIVWTENVWNLPSNQEKN